MHVALAAAVIATVVIAHVAIRRSRGAVADADAMMRDAALAQRASAEMRAWLAATWRYAVTGTTPDRERAKAVEKQVARARAPLEDRPGASELLEALDASAAATAWALEEHPATTLSASDLRAQLSRIANELDGASWRLDATLTRHLEAIDDAGAGGWGTWSERAVFALFALAVVAVVASSIVIVRELAKQERRASDNKQLESQLQRQREELVRASRDVHSSLQGMARLADELRSGSAGPGREPRTSEHVASRIGEAARRLDDQLAALFDATRIELGEATLRREYCDSRALIIRAMQMHQPRASQRAIRLRSEAGIAGPVLADRERISQVLATLIGSALEPARPGGEIVVSTTAEERAVRFAISDVTPPATDAIGLRREPAVSAFELYTCKRLVEAHGGSLGVDRAHGRGHTFWFTLPDEPRLLR